MGVARSVLARWSTGEDEQACEVGGKSKRRIEHIAPDDIGNTLDGDGKRVRGCDYGGASNAIVRYSGGQLHCSDEETQSLLFSSKPRTAAGGDVLDPSGSGENVQHLRSFEIDPTKHKIFLSHSGAQKNFVEQLCVDLEARGYLFPFFDQRHHSLPKGKDFAPLIKQAAGQCHVAVIVLSKKFLCSKWPMIELAEFHAAKQGGNRGMSMLPLFYKLKVGDLDDESIEGRWMPVWNELASKDKRIDVSRWAAAVKALRGINGLPFDKHNNSEVGYRKEIVGSIWRMSPGDLLYDSAREMVGYDRFCETISTKFVDCLELGVSVLGLYGASGLGKSIVAKALCDYFAGEFEGRVCHVELGAMTRLKRQKWMLKTLCGLEEDVLRRVPDDRKGLKLMRNLMKREPVLLVIDNLTNDASSRREAHEYLTVGFHWRSKVMITARSEDVLHALIPGMEFCMSIPKLNVEEAGMIFLRSAAPMRCFSSVTDEERRVLRLCVEKCLLACDGYRYPVRDENPDDSLSTGVPKYGAYHPLALSALGDFFYRLSGNTEVLQWKDRLERDHELMRDVLQCPSITSIIRVQFSTFSWSEQLLFLDLAFYLNTYYFWRLFLDGETFEYCVKWLGLFYGETESVVERRLRDLKRSGIIDWLDKYGFRFEVLSLYREFAEWYMTEHGVIGLKNARGVFQPCASSLGSDPQGSKCISDLVRLRVFDPPRASLWILMSKRLRDMHNLVLLQLYDCTNLRALNLAGLDSLRHLELVRLSNLVTLTLTESSGTQEDGGILESLMYVMFYHLESLTHVPDLRSCTSLRFLGFSRCRKVSDFEGVECPRVWNLSLQDLIPQQLERAPNFMSFSCLTDLAIHFDGDVDLSLDLAILLELNRRTCGQNVAQQDWEVSDESSEDSDEFSDDSDALRFVDPDNDPRAKRRILYMPLEKQYVKEGLSVVQYVLSYQYEQRQRHTHTRGFLRLRWKFNEGDTEVLKWMDSMGKNLCIDWRFRSPEEYNAEEYDD